MKKRIALVGLGNLSPKLSPSLTDNAFVEVVAISDKEEQAVGRTMYGDVPYHKDYRELVRYQPDFVYVATDPATHCEIAAFFLERGFAVLSEKPPTRTWEEYQVLKELAARKHVFYNVVYHFRYSRELLWLKEHLSDFGRLTFASARFDDPYCENGANLPGREFLMGAWMDSGSNILGAWSFLFPELICEDAHTTIERDSIHHLPIRAVAAFRWNQTPFSISISWENHTRNKEMLFVFERDVVYIDLPTQKVYVNGKLVLKNSDPQSTVVHYTNFFNGFDRFYTDQQGDTVTAFLYQMSI